MAINITKRSHKFYKPNTKKGKYVYEDITKAQTRLGLDDLQVLEYTTQYDKASAIIDNLQASKDVILPPNYIAKNTVKLHNIDDFNKRLEQYYDIQDTEKLIEKTNRQADRLFYKLIKRLTDDKSVQRYLYKKYNKLSIAEKHDFFAENGDLREVVFYEDDFTQQVFNFNAQKLGGYLDYEIEKRNKK